MFIFNHIINKISTLNGRYKSSRPEVFYKKGVLNNFANFTGKHMWVPFLLKLQAVDNFILLKIFVGWAGGWKRRDPFDAPILWVFLVWWINKKKFSKYVLQSKDRLVTSSRPLLFFIILFIKRDWIQRKKWSWFFRGFLNILF